MPTGRSTANHLADIGGTVSYNENLQRTGDNCRTGQIHIPMRAGILLNIHSDSAFLASGESSGQ